MNKKNITAILMALVITILVLCGLYFGYKQQTKPEETIEVAVTIQEIKAGELLMLNKNYNYQKIPKSKLTPSHVTKEQIEKKSDDNKTIYALSDILNNKEVTTSLYANEPIMKGRVSGLSGVSNIEGEEIDLSQYRKMTYSVSDTQSLEGQVVAGDRVDFWIRYKLNDKTNKDQLVVVDKVLKNVLINKTFDANGQEISDPSIPAKTIEILLLEEEIQEYLKYKDLGKYTIVKVPVSAIGNEDEIVRKKLSTNDLIWEIISMEEDAVTADKIKKDPTKLDKVEDIEIEGLE